MFEWLFGRELNDVLKETKKIKVNGIRFTIRKVNLLNYADGSKVLIQSYDTHKTDAQKQGMPTIDFSNEKIRRHFSDILVAGIAYPKVVHQKDDSSGICVDDLFMDWTLAMEVYNQIMELTYGKKKIKQASRAKDL